MNSRERVLAALKHKQPDRPPRDLGSTTATGIHPRAYKALKRHLGWGEDWHYISSRAQLACVEAPILDRFGIDLLPIIADSAATSPILDERRRYVDRWGVERGLPEIGGHYYVVRPSLEDADRISDLAAHVWPEPNLEWPDIRGRARHLSESTDKALVLNLEVGFLHQAQFMRGFDRWLIDLVSDPSLAAALMDHILDIWLAEADAMIEAVRGCADVVIYADDIAFQDQPMMSPALYRSLIKPRQKRVFDLLTGSGMTVLYHSCGDVSSLLPDLVEMGVQALNPIQVSAGQMGRTSELKKVWGRELTFWGGIDTQEILPRGTLEQVRREVWRRLDDLSIDGGYVMAAVHDVQPEIPPQNLCAMFDAAEEWSVRQITAAR